MRRMLRFCLTLVLSGYALAALGHATMPPQAIKVACVGDSITAGSGLPQAARESYPAQLGALLGAGYDVGNFGKSGATLLNAGDKPYRQQPEFALARAFGPAVVVIALGTNDTKPQNWQHRAQFAADYAALIREFRALPSQPRILLCQPMPAWPPSGWGISPELIAGDLRKLVAEIAAQEKVELIDLYTPLLPHHALVADHVHPNAQGAAILAQTVAAAIRAEKE